MNKTLRRPAAAAIVTATIIFLASFLVYASSGGRIGQTRKDSQTAGCGANLGGGGACHGTSANSSIQVTVSGPPIIPIGTPRTYTISLAGSSGGGGGLDVAVSSGTLSTSSTELQLLAGELTHVAPITTPYSIDFTFSSNDPGTVTMYANGKGSASANGWNWAPDLSIRVGPPLTPDLLSPPDGSTGVPTSPTLTWSGISGATSNIEVSISPTFTTTVESETGLVGSSYSVPAGILQDNTLYYWRVNATDPGGTSDWSKPWTFTTVISAPLAPTLLSPTNGSMDVSTTPTLNWNASAGASSYSLAIATDAGFTNVWRIEIGITDTSWKVAPALTIGTRYYWRVSASSLSGGDGDWSPPWSFVTLLTSVDGLADGVPSDYALAQNYPNPFNPSTQIRFALPVASTASLSVYDVQGREVAALVRGHLSAGIHSVTLDASSLQLPSGVYYYRLKAGQFSDAKKLLLIK